MKISKALLKTKAKATGIHFCLSLVVFFALAYQIFYVWYPPPYFVIDGGWQGIRIVAAIDLVLGPFITFLIFDLSKSRREITLDLLIIATVQIGALIYGVVTTYEQRPVAIVVVDDFAISAVENDYKSQLNSLDELKRYSPQNFPVIFMNIPLTPEGIKEMMRIRAEEDIAEHAQLQLYQPHSMLAPGLLKSQPAQLKRLQEPVAKQDYQQWLVQNQKKAEDVLVLPFIGRYGESWLVFAKNGKFLGHF